MKTEERSNIKICPKCGQHYTGNTDLLRMRNP